MDPKTHPLNGNGNGNGIAPPRGYAMSGKIMLSAIVVLFSVVLFILFLHLYVRYHVYRRQQRRQRRRQRFIFSSSVDHAPSKGLDPAVLSSLSVISFSPDGDVTDEDDAAGECAVCLSDFVDGEKVRVLPRCDHRFHVDCIDMWFCSHSNCPLCRSPVEIEEVTSPIKNSTLCADPTVEIGSGSSSHLDRDPENSSEEEEEEEEQLGFWSWILAVRRFLRREARPIPDLERGEAAAAAE